MSSRSPALLEADRIGFVRGERHILNAVSAAFHGGEWTAVVGPNGAGKSTFMAILAGLLHPHEGAVRLAGRSVRSWPIRERARRLAWFGQTGVSNGEIAAQEVVRLGRLPRYGLLGTPTAADEAAVTAALDETEATPFALRRLGELSGGERQRVLLARAFAADASVFLFDEPTLHLDAPHQRRLVRSLQWRARAGAAVISVLHDLTLALTADRWIVLAEGQVRADGSPQDSQTRAWLTAVFDNAFSIERLNSAGLARWVAVPTL
jgi:iron complex transport system ATP-binding protein